jgi:SET domain-containing protein
MKTTGAAVAVKPSHSGTGEGLYARADIVKGDFIVEYTGTKITTKAADALKTRYLFELDDNWTIDGETPSNIARYINHSCEPDAEAEIHDGHILISAVRDIRAGGEITIDYGEEYFDEFIRPLGCKCAAKKHH